MDTQTQTGTYHRPLIDANIIKIRLDTSELIQQIELFLRGSRIKYEQDADGKLKTNIEQIGRPKANSEGIQSLLNWVSSTVNPHTVQGNFPIDKSGNCPKYDAYIFEYHVELAELLVNNCYNWEISDDEISGIIEFIMLCIMPFMSRLIDNKERESYTDTMKTTESATVTNKSGFGIFGGANR